MPKRKREFEPPAPSNEPTLTAQQQRVQFKLSQHLTALGQAFKLAKGFERQKLGRRSKNALTENRNTDAKRIAEEIEALKGLDAGGCAKQYLFKTLCKIRAVAESDRLPPGVVGYDAIVPGEAAGLNVFGRLCNANPVKEAMKTIVPETKSTMGLKVEAGEAAGKKKRLRAKDYAEMNGEAAKEDAPAQEKKSKQAKESSNSESEFAGFDDEDGENDDDDDESNHLGSSDMEDQDTEDEELNIEELERRLEQEGITRKPSKKAPKKGAYDHEADLSLSESQSDDSRSASPEPKKTKSRASEPAPRKSAFIPSLSMGGYVSGSDGEDIEDFDIAPPKKNRRGQRARQQIWEKKYGKLAKHVVNPKPGQENGGSRAAGWDMKRGATDSWRGRGGGGGARGGGRGGFTGGDRGARSGGDAAPPKKHQDDAGPIHPSWEAAKAAKANRGPVAYAGTKISFD